MKLGRRTVFVSKKDLEKIFSIPKGVEIIGIKEAGGLQRGWDFELISAGEVSVGETKVTVITDDDNTLIRKVSPETLRNLEGDVKRSFINNVDKNELVVPINVLINLSTESKSNAGDMVKELVKAIKRKTEDTDVQGNSIYEATKLISEEKEGKE
jgi:hypothetical protein